MSMRKVIGNHPALVSTLEKFIGISLEEHANILLVDVDAFVANRKEVVSAIERGLPVIFYGFDTLESLLASGMVVASYFHLRNTGYMQLPFRATEGLVVLYDRIVRSKNVTNKALTLLAKVSAKNHDVNIFLHDLSPGKADYQETLWNVMCKFGITGTLEEVREKLEELRSRELKSRAVAELAQGEVLPGVFCDIEGTLVVGGEVNSAILEKLNEYSKDRAVTLWTGGNITELRSSPALKGIYYPLVSKYDFFDCKVETVIDDLAPEKFFEEYGITASEYVQVEK